MHRNLMIAVVVAGLTPALAQQSSGYRLEEHTFNSGAGQLLTSAGYRVTLDALGSAVGRLGLSSPAYQSEAGFVPAYRPPGEVLSLSFLDALSLEWTPEPSVGTYTLYRGGVADLDSLQFGGCEQSAISTPGTMDSDLPSSGEGYFYLVTASNRLGEEGTKGSQSDGTPRAGATCP